jgi:hypothetical protein
MTKGKILKECESRLMKPKLGKNLRAKLMTSSRRQISVAGELCSISPNYTGPMSYTAIGPAKILLPVAA